MDIYICVFCAGTHREVGGYAAFRTVTTHTGHTHRRDTSVTGTPRGGGGGGEGDSQRQSKIERNRERQRQRETETENSNSKAVFYEDRILGSIKSGLTTSPC